MPEGWGVIREKGTLYWEDTLPTFKGNVLLSRSLWPRSPGSISQVLFGAPQLLSYICSRGQISGTE